MLFVIVEAVREVAVADVNDIRSDTELMMRRRPVPLRFLPVTAAVPFSLSVLVRKLDCSCFDALVFGWFLLRWFTGFFCPFIFKQTNQKGIHDDNPS